MLLIDMLMRIQKKIALLWCNDFGEEKKFTFKDIKNYSNKAANLIRNYGIKKRR